MSVLNLNGVTPSTIAPNFIHKANYLAVETTEGWEYYPIKVEKEVRNGFIHILKTPAVVAEGIICLAGKNYYKATPEDIVRRRVHVRNACPSPVASPVAGSDNRNQPATSGTSEFEISEDDDLAYEEQRQSLFCSQDQEGSFF